MMKKMMMMIRNKSEKFIYFKITITVRALLDFCYIIQNKYILKI